MLTGTTIEAARVLGISQPAISRLIADFEEAIGFKLFDRIGRRVAPTAEADILIDEVKRALTGLDQIRETAAEIARFRYSRLRLVSIPSVASTIVVDLIRVFADRYPDTFVSLEVRASDAAVEYVVSQQCDLGIATPAMESPAFQCSTLLVGLSRCILPKGHRLAALDMIRPEDLADESFISFRPDAIFRSQLDAIFVRHKVNRLLEIRGAHDGCHLQHGCGRARGRRDRAARALEGSGKRRGQVRHPAVQSRAESRPFADVVDAPAAARRGPTIHPGDRGIRQASGRSPAKAALNRARTCGPWIVS